MFGVVWDYLLVCSFFLYRIIWLCVFTVHHFNYLFMNSRIWFFFKPTLGYVIIKRCFLHVQCLYISIYILDNRISKIFSMKQITLSFSTCKKQSLHKQIISVSEFLCCQKKTELKICARYNFTLTHILSVVKSTFLLFKLVSCI